MNIKTLKAKLLEQTPEKVLSKNDFLSSGSTLLNLACSGRIDGCYAKGIYHSLTGDSDTGKSVLAITALAEASISSNFKNYQLIYYNAERANLLSLDYFPSALRKRIEILFPSTLEEFYYDIDDRMKKGSIVSVLDSMDSLSTEADEKTFQKGKAAFKKGKEGPGSYGTKAKVNAGKLNRTCGQVRDTNSILLVISQTRDNFNASMFGPKKTRSGGHALKFYNRFEVWFSVREHLKQSYKGNQIQIGTKAKCSVKKNHLSGKKRDVEICIYNDHGLDDTGDCINYLLFWKHWKGSENSFKAPEFLFSGGKEELVKKIRAKKETRLPRLKKIVAQVWDEVESAVKLDRSPNYE